MPTRIGPYLTNFTDVYELALEYSNDSDKPYGGSGDNKWKQEYAGMQYRGILSELSTATIHVAWYGHGDYEGESFVLYEKDGKLYENHGSHCSCNGLEGQWQPEETTWKAVSQWKPSSDHSGADQVTEILEPLFRRQGIIW